MNSTPDKPVVAVLATGGTISMSNYDRLSLVDYAEGGRRLGVDELVASVPELSDVATIMTQTLTESNSLGFGSRDWISWGRRIAQMHESMDITGFVLIHGTASLEESAYFLSLALDVPQPVVVIGAQRPYSGISTDASINLLNGVRLAADPAAKDLGVVVAFNEQIHTARDVTKSVNHRLEAFQSRTLGPIGYIESGGLVELARRPTRPSTVGTPFHLGADLDQLPRVDIAYSYAESDGTAIRAFVEAGAKGIVCAGFAPGRLTQLDEDAARRASDAGVHVVQSSRAGAGRVMPRQAAQKAGFLLANDLTPQKAKILLALALTVTDDREQIQAMFDRF